MKNGPEKKKRTRCFQNTLHFMTVLARNHGFWRNIYFSNKR